jgi:hypothetical protein
MIDPVSQDELRTAVQGYLDEWWRPMLINPERLHSREYQAYAVLSLCRALYTLQYGHVASKMESARWAQPTLGERWIGLIDRALAWPQGDQPDEMGETIEFIRFALQ